MRTTRCVAGRAAIVLLVLSFALLLQAASAQVHPVRRTLPGTPVDVVAVPLREAAIVAWLLQDDPQNGLAQNPSAATSYTITAYDTAVPSALVTSVRADAPGAEVGGLSGNHCYAFRVRAANRAGSSPESDPSEPVCLPPIPGADLEVTVSAPETAPAGSDVTFTLLVKNNGAGDAAIVTLEASLISPLSSHTTSQGICQTTAGAIGLRCNLGGVYAGGTATVTIDVSMGSIDLTTNATVKAFEGSGASLDDPVPANNTATASIRLQPE